MIGITAIRDPLAMQATLNQRASQNLSERPAFYVVQPSTLVAKAKEIQRTATEAQQEMLAMIRGLQRRLDVSA